jgi:hypothetical protein
MSFMTFVIFTWLLAVIMLTLMNEYYEYYPYSRAHFDSHLLHANLLNKGQSSSHPYGNGNIIGYEKNKQDGITILSYTAILAAIIIPNMNQID